MTDEVGSTSVRVDPDLSYFEEDLKAGLEEATADESGDVVIKVKVDDTEARANMAEDKAMEDSLSGSSTYTYNDDFSLPNQKEWDDLSAAMEKAGVDSEVFGDKMTEAGIEVEDLTQFSDQSGIALDDLVGHMDNAGTTARSMTQDFQRTQTVFSDMGDYTRSLGVSMDDIDARAKQMDEDWKKVDQDTETLGKDLDGLGGSGGNAGDGLSKASSGAKDAEDGMSGLIAAAVTLGPALIPVAGVVTAAFLGVADAAVAGGLGIGAFALAAGPDMGEVKDQAKDLLTSFQTLVAPDVIPVLNGSVGLMKDAFQAAVPLVGQTSDALLDLEQKADSALQSPSWHGFTTFIDAEARPAIDSFGTDLFNLGHGFANLLEAFAPVETQMEHGLEDLTGEFERWTSSTGGVHSFVDWFETEGPQVGRLLENLGSTAGLLLQAFGGWGQVLIAVANPLLEVVNDLLRVNPVVGEITAALIVGAVAWSKWGDSVQGGITAVKEFPQTLDSINTKIQGFIDGSNAAAAATAKQAASSDGLVTSEIAAAAAAQRDGQAQAELGLLSQGAAVDQGELAAAMDATTASTTGLGTTAKDTGESVGSLGEDATGAGGALAGGSVAADSFGVGLGSVAEVALPLAATLAGMFLLMQQGKDNANDLTEKVNELTKGMDTQAGTTLPQLNTSLRTNQELQQSLTNANFATAQSILGAKYNTDSYTDSQKDATAAVLTASDQQRTYQAAIDKVTTTVNEDKIAIASYKTNLDTLSTALGVSKDSAADLANELAINLTKGLSGTQIDQAREYLVQLSSQAGITQSTLESLAETTSGGMAALTKAMNGAGTATAKAFSGAEDAVSALQGQTTQTGGDLLAFYQQQETNASAFATNITQALKDGYSPTLINQILQQGPAANAMLQQMVNDGNAAYVQDTKNAASALQQATDDAKEQASIGAGAIASGNQKLLASLPEIAAIEGAKTQAALTGNIADAINGLNTQYPGWQALATKYGVTMSNSFKQYETQTYLEALAQTQEAAAGQTAGKPNVDKAAEGPAKSLSTQALADIGEAQKAGMAQVGQLGAGITEGKPLVDTAAKPPASSLGNLANAALGDVTKAGAQQGANLGSGIGSALGAVSAIGETLATQMPTKANSHVPDTEQAGSNQGFGLFSGITSQVTAIGQVADTAGSQVHEKAAAHNTDAQTAGSTQMDQFKTGITSKEGEVEQAATTVGEQTAAKVGSGMQGKEGDVASTFLSTVKSAIESTAAQAGGQSVGEAMDNGVAQGAQQNEGTIASALLGAVKDAIGVAASQAGGQSVGAALANGIAAGISGSASVVDAAAAGAVNSAKSAANQAANTKSPSQVFRDEVGAPIGQGIALGIQDTAGLVQSSAASLVNSAMTGFKRGSIPSVSVGASLAQAATAANGVAAASAGIVIYSNPNYTITGDPSQSTIAQFKKLQNDHDLELVSLLKAHQP